MDSSPFVAFVQSMVEEATGIHYRAEDASIFADKVVARAHEQGYESLLDYYYRLRYDDPGGQELAALVDRVVVNESYLFREGQQLEAMLRECIAPAVTKNGSARLWSAACANGEEPFSVVMMLKRDQLDDRVEVVASDVSHRTLERARTGMLSKRSVRPIAPSLSGDRFYRVDEHAVVVDPAIVNKVRFERVNLLVPAEIRALGTFDVILCRNVLIYFRERTVEKVVSSLHDALVPGGTLFVGVSESLLRIATPLACEEKRGVFFYRRVA